MVGIDGRGPLRAATTIYRTLLELAFMALPMVVAGYLLAFDSGALIFRDYGFHEVAIGISILLSGFAAWVAWRCYVTSGDPALRNVTLAFLGFAIVYAPHGALTRMADHNMWLFLLFGPASRVVMAGFLLEALLRLKEAPDPVERRRLGVLRNGLLICLAISLAVVALAHSPVAGDYRQRLLVEGFAIAMCVTGILVIRRRRLNSGLMWLYQVALAAFAQSSICFLLAKPWNHLWWFAHAIFAGGFFILSYGLVRAFHTTRSFATVYDEEQMIARLAASEAESRVSRENEAQLRILFDASPLGILVADAAGRILYANRRQAELVGLSTQALAGQDERRFYAEPSLRDRFAAQALESREAVSCELECLLADGARSWSLVTWMPMAFGSGPALVAWNVDITERRQAAEAQEAAKEAAVLANRAKTEFLAAMSHELRTPLNAINGFAETMHGEILGPMGNERYKEYARHILESGRHLTDLINDVLDVAKIEMGRVPLREEVLSLPRLVEAVLVMVADRAREAGVILRSEMVSGLPALRADERRVKQVLINVLGNAVKFTPAQGSIHVRAWRDGDGSLAVSVTDTGIGIRAEDREKIFASFVQVDSRLARRYEGLGLGLPLSRSLMEQHGGTITVESQEGQGTTVTLRFPASRAVTVAA